MDHLEIARYAPSGKKEDHRYGFYWSPIFPDHERPNKWDIEYLIGLENYFDLVGSSQIITDAALNFKQEVEALVAKGELLMTARMIMMRYRLVPILWMAPKEIWMAAVMQTCQM